MSWEEFEVVPLPSSAKNITKCVYAELFEVAVGAGEGMAVAVECADKRTAAHRLGSLKEGIKRWSRRDERWRNLEAFRRGSTIYVHNTKEGGE